MHFLLIGHGLKLGLCQWNSLNYTRLKHISSQNNPTEAETRLHCSEQALCNFASEPCYTVSFWSWHQAPIQGHHAVHVSFKTQSSLKFPMHLLVSDSTSLSVGGIQPRVRACKRQPVSSTAEPASRWENELGWVTWQPRGCFPPQQEIANYTSAS